MLCTLGRRGCGVPGRACKMGGMWHVGLILPGLPRSPLGGGEGARQVRCGCMAGEEVNRDSGSKQLGVQLVLVKGSPPQTRSPLLHSWELSLPDLARAVTGHLCPPGQQVQAAWSGGTCWVS